MWQLDNDENLHEYIKEKMGFIQGDVQLTDGKARGPCTSAHCACVHIAQPIQRCTSPALPNPIIKST